MANTAPDRFGPAQAAICLFAGLALLSLLGGGTPEARRAPGTPVRRAPDKLGALALISGMARYFTGRAAADRIAVEVNGERRLMTPESHRRLLVFAVERVLYRMLDFTPEPTAAPSP